MIRRLYDHFVRADSIHAIEKALAFAVQSSFDAQRGKFIGNHANRPSGSVFAAAVASVGEDLLGRLAFIARAEGASSRVALDVHALPNEIHGALAAIGRDDDPASRDGILAKLRQNSPPCYGVRLFYYGCCALERSPQKTKAKSTARIPQGVMAAAKPETKAPTTSKTKAGGLQ